MTQVKDGLVKRGATWSYIVRVRDPQTGKMKDQWKGGFQTQKEAKAARNDARSASDKGTAVAASRITVREYLEQWLEAVRDARAAHDAGQLRQHVENHIVPRIGGERLQQLTPLDDRPPVRQAPQGGPRVEGEAEGRRKKPKGTATLLSAAPSPRRRDAAPGAERCQPQGPAPLQPRGRGGAAQGRAGRGQRGRHADVDPRGAGHVPRPRGGDRLFPMWRLAAWTGMRRGESGRPHLARRDWTPARSRCSGRGSPWRVPTCARASRRRPGPPGRRARQGDHGGARGLAGPPEARAREVGRERGHVADDGLVFTLQDGRASSRLPEPRLPRAREAGRSCSAISLHDMRHTHATLMLAAGVPVKVVSERLGH